MSSSSFNDAFIHKSTHQDISLGLKIVHVHLMVDRINGGMTLTTTSAIAEIASVHK